MRISDWSSDVCSSDLLKFLQRLMIIAFITLAFFIVAQVDGHSCPEPLMLFSSPFVSSEACPALVEAVETLRAKTASCDSAPSAWESYATINSSAAPLYAI